MTENELEKYLSDRLALHTPRKINQPELREAGVLIAITAEEYPRLVLTQRSLHVSTHQGEVAFPGGKRDLEDENIIATAIREAEEEIGLNPDSVRIIGELDQVVSRFGYLITPILAIIPAKLDYIANPEELDVVFEVPLAHFQDQPKNYFERDSFRIPTYDYEGFRIWGITAMMIAEMMNNIWDCDISLQF